MGAVLTGFSTAFGFPFTFWFFAFTAAFSTAARLSAAFDTAARRRVRGSTEP